MQFEIHLSYPRRDNALRMDWEESESRVGSSRRRERRLFSPTVDDDIYSPSLCGDLAEIRTRNSGIMI